MASKKRRVLSLVLTLAMVLGMLPMNAWAADGDPITGPDTEVVLDDEGGPNIRKTYADGKITMEAYVKGTMTTTSDAKPTDMILVLDASGSMRACIGCGKNSHQNMGYTYKEVYEDGTLDKSKTYYYGNGNKKNEVSWSDYRQGWRAGGSTLYPKTSATDVEFSHTQFYERVYNSADHEFCSRMDALKTAANTLVDIVAKACSETAVDHRIGIVKFGDDSTILTNSTGNTVGNTSAGSSLREVATEADATYLQTIINGLDDSGTNQGAGMQAAQSIFAAYNANEADFAERNHVVVLLTDGDPREQGDEDDWDRLEKIDIANNAITAAKALKGAPYNAKVYSIGMFDGAVVNTLPSYSGSWNDTSANNTNRMMQLVSSNYPNATAMANGSEGANGDPAGKYYLVPKNASDLEEIFKGIAQDNSRPSVTAGTDTVLTDTLSDFFTFNGTATDVVKVYTADYKGNGTWAARQEFTGAQVAIDGKNIEVKNFDYTANFVWDKEDGNAAGEKFGGKKLIIEIPVKPDTSCDKWTDADYYDTNKDNVGMECPVQGGDDVNYYLPGSPVSKSPDGPVDTYLVRYSWGGSGITAGKPGDTYHIKDQVHMVNNTQVGQVFTGSNGQQYKLVGWAANGTNPDSTITIDNKPVTLTAVLTRVYSVTYLGTGATAGDPPTDAQSPYTDGASVTVLTGHGTLEKTGYTFGGWTTTDVYVVENGFTMPAKNVVFTPVWNANDHNLKITYVDESGNALAPEVNCAVKFDDTYSFTSPEIRGYKLKEQAQATITGTVTGDVNIQVVYVPDTSVTNPTKYTVNHVTVLDGQEKVEDTDDYTSGAWIHDTTPEIAIQEGSLNQNTYQGYMFDHYELGGVTVAATDLYVGLKIPDNSVIDIVYVKNTSVTHDIAYTVKHVVNGVVDGNVITVTESGVWINDNDLTVTADSVALRTYPGYVHSSTTYTVNGVTTPVTAGMQVPNGAEIIIAYTANLGDTVQTYYTVEHVAIVDGQTIVLKAEQRYDSSDWAGTPEANRTAQVTADSIAPQIFEGYTYVSRTSEAVRVPNGTKVTLTYEANLGVTTSVGYTVQHRQDGQNVGAPISVTANIWANAPKQLTVTAESIAQHEYLGYDYVSTTCNGAAIDAGAVVADGSTIYIDYVKNNQTQSVSYTVEHVTVLDGSSTVEWTSQPITGTDWIGETNPKIAVTGESIAADTAIIARGYMVSTITYQSGAATVTVVAGAKVPNGTKVTVTYVKDESQRQDTYYTVEHKLIHRDGTEEILVAPQTYPGTDWKGEANPTITVTAESIAHYAPLPEGYSFDAISPTSVVANGKVASGTHITLFYKDVHYGEFTVTYTGEAVTASTTYHKANDGITIAADPARTDYVFEGWVCDLDNQVYQAGASYTVTADVVFTAKWAPVHKEVEISKALTLVNGEAYVVGTKVNAGDVLTYSVTVVNKGNVDLPVVEIKDSLVGFINFENVLANDPVGVTKTYTYKVPAEKAGAVVVNSVVAKDENVVDGGGDEVETPVNGLTLTINYVYAGGGKAADSYTKTGMKHNEAYSVTSPAISGYTPNIAVVSGKITANTTITVTYSYTYIPPIIHPINPPKEEDIPDEEVPLAGILNVVDHFAYIVGYDDGLVKPDNNITRAEVATIFFRLMTDEYRDINWSTVNDFPDVKTGSWYNNAISTSVSAGIVKGYPDGTFKPNNKITRAEFAAIAARFLSDEYDGVNLFKDIEGHWAEELINRAANAGWINGYPDGTFRPNAYITRAEAMQLINNMLGREPHLNHLLEDMRIWADNRDIKKWYYLAVQEATNSHDYDFVDHDDEKDNDVGYHEIWTELLPDRDWAALENLWSESNDAPGGEVMD